MEIVGKVFYLLTIIHFTYQMPLPVVQLQLEPGNEREVTIGDLYLSQNCEIKVSFREPSELHIVYLDTDDSSNNEASGPQEEYSPLTYRIERNSPNDVIEISGTGTENNQSIWRIQASPTFNGTSHTFIDISSVDIKLRTPNCLDLNRSDTTSYSNDKRWNGKIIITALRLNCSIPKVPEFGNIRGPYSDNNTLEFVCMSGFVLRGRNYLSCVQNENGKHAWNGLPPSCVQDSCPSEESRVSVLDEDNYLATPGYPEGITKNVTCSWKLIPQKDGNCIAIKIIKIELPPGVRTYFEIFEMLEDSSRRILFSSLNSSDINRNTFTTCNKGFVIYFKSDEVTRRYRGVYLSYTSRPDTSGYQVGRYRKVQLNTTQDVLPITPTVNTQDAQATGSSHKLKAGVVAAAVIIPIVAVIAISAVILYVWYRKKYPVRMIIGKDFGKFTNPAYEKRHSTATLTRQQDSFEKEIEKMSAATGVSHYNPVDLSDESDFHQQYQPTTTQNMLLKNMGYRDSLDLTDDDCNKDSLAYNSSAQKKIIHPEIDFKEDATDGDSSENEDHGRSYTYMDKPSQLKVHNKEDESDVSSEISPKESTSSGNEDDSDDGDFMPLKNVPNVRRKRVSAYLNEVLDRHVSEEASVNEEQEIQNEQVLSNETDNAISINEAKDQSDGRESDEEIPKDEDPKDIHVYENVVIGEDGMMNRPEFSPPFLDKEATNEEEEGKEEEKEEEDNSYFCKGITPVYVQADESSTNDASSVDESISDSEDKSKSYNAAVYDNSELETAIPDNELGKNETRYTIHLNIGDGIVNSKLDENIETHEGTLSESSDIMVSEHFQDASSETEASAINVLDLELVPNGNSLDIAQIELSDISDIPNTNSYEDEDISGSSESLHTMGTKSKRIKTLNPFPSFSIDGGSMESLASVEYAEFEKGDLELPPVPTGDNDSSENKQTNVSQSTYHSGLVVEEFSDFFRDENHTLLPNENSNKTLVSDTQTELKLQHVQMPIDDTTSTVKDEESNVASVGVSETVSESNSETFSDPSIDLGLITTSNISTEGENNSFQNSKLDLPLAEISTNPFDNLSDDPSVHQTGSSQLQKRLLDVHTLGIEENGSDTDIGTPSSSEKGEDDEEEKTLVLQGTLIPDVRRQSDNTTSDLPNSYQYSGNSSHTNISPEEIVPKLVTSDNPATDVSNTNVGKSADGSWRVIRPDILAIDDSSTSHSSDEESVSDADDDDNTNEYTVNPASDQCSEVFGFGESTDDNLILPLSFDQSEMDEVNGTKVIPALNTNDFDLSFKGKTNDSDESDISIDSDVIKEVSSDSDNERGTQSNVRKKSSFKVNLTPDLHTGDNDSVDV